MKLRRIVLSALGCAGALTLWLGAAGSARACAVCGAATTATTMALLWMSIMLSMLPFAMAGGLALWLWYQARAEKRRVSEIWVGVPDISGARAAVAEVGAVQLEARSA